MKNSSYADRIEAEANRLFGAVPIDVRMQFNKNKGSLDTVAKICGTRARLIRIAKLYKLARMAKGKRRES